MSQGTKRADIRPGLSVDIVLKKDQPTGKLTRGIVKDLLTSKAVHPRGIKVRLESGQVGRVQKIVGRDGAPEATTAEEADEVDEDFNNFI